MSKNISPPAVRRFRRTVIGYYRRHGRNGRDLPWRATRDPYRILVSEFMLQQTQVERVRKKYREFLKAFPSIRSLAHAPLNKVLAVWQGLGYNRRAKNLLHCAKVIVEKHKGRIPQSRDDLISLPGVGQSTAGGILAFAFNLPAVFIETNIRSVFIHFFFKGKENVEDGELLPLLEKTMDKKNPREWYYALMDYGVCLKQAGPDPGRRSAGYKKQSPFKGSRREVRGGVLKLLNAKPQGLTLGEMKRYLKKEESLIVDVADELVREGFLEKYKRRFRVITGS